MSFIRIFFFLGLTISQIFAWQALPQIPSGRRSQFLVLNEDGGYKYGYDTGDGSAAKQSADASNQVAGHYFYKNSAGQNVDLKYTSGVQGFVPEGLEKLLPKADVPQAISTYSSISSSADSSDSQANTGDASYSFGFDTDTYKRQESSDARGNVKGSYSYRNAAGVHDLSYIAGENTGFVATSGTLARANGLKEGQDFRGTATGYSYPKPAVTNAYLPPVSQPRNLANADGSYAFSYSTSDSSRHESADAGNNVQGKYSYQNGAGSHDLSYVAGARTGFLVTGGSLSKPNGLADTPTASFPYSASPVILAKSAEPSHVSSSLPAADGSYSFGFSTGDQSRQETSDASGNVQGSYSYRTAGGNQDLSYVAGSATGFQVTGGSLATPTNLLPANNLAKTAASSTSYDNDDQANTGDASYNFSIDTDDYKRQESADSSGNVRGSYSYKNNAGTHDLSYVAGSETGFVATGGSLSNPEVSAKIAATIPAVSVPTQTYLPVNTDSVVIAKTHTNDNSDDLANTGDSSYSFTIDTDDYKREESSDPSGNVRGKFSYKNAAGSHDLSYVAGSATGFLPTGGSLSDPNAITAKIANLPYNHQPTVEVKSSLPLTKSSNEGYSEETSGDASYSFSIDTDDYKRHEASDASGNVRGSYSYKNSVGNHDLSYVAGSATGFQATGGSLSLAPGVSEGQLRSGSVLAKSSVITTPIVHQAVQVKSAVLPSIPLPVLNSVVASPKTYRLDNNIVVHSYLPPSNEKRKFGYIFDTV